MSEETSIFKPDTALEPWQEEIMREAQREANTAFDIVLPRLSMPSGKMKAFQTGSGDAVSPPLSAVIVVAQKGRAWWPSSDVSGTPPLCSSADARHGTFNPAPSEADIALAQTKDVLHPYFSYDPGEAPQVYDCDTCPMSAFGGECKPQQRCVLFVEGWAMPALFSIPRMSMKAFNTYASSIMTEHPGNAYFSVVTKLGLEKATSSGGVEYSRLTLEFERYLTREEYMNVKALREQYESVVRTTDLDFVSVNDIDPVTGEGADGPSVEF